MFQAKARWALLAIFILAAATRAAAQCPPSWTSAVRETGYALDLKIDYEGERITAQVRLTVENRGDQPAHVVSFLLYRLMSVEAVRDVSGRPLEFRQAVVGYQDWPQLQVTWAQVTLREPVPPAGQTTLALVYSGYLLGYNETGMLYVRDRVDREFTILRPDAFAYPVLGYPCLGSIRAAGLPSFDYVARITVPRDMIVANGGALVDRSKADSLVTYTYRNTRPAWRMDFAIAPYGVLESGANRVYYLPGDSAGAALVVSALASSLALFERWFGPLAERAGLTIIEIPDGWGSQNDVTTIIQAAAAFRDPNRLNEVYHEVSHFWNVPDLDRPSPRWNEGLASFLEDLATEELEGRPVLMERNRALLGWLRTKVEERPELREVPLADYGRAEMTDFAYSVGAAMFAVLYELTGPEAFRGIVGGFYQRHHESGATTDDLVSYARGAAPVSLDAFFDDWIRTTGWVERVRAYGTVEEIAASYRRD